MFRMEATYLVDCNPGKVSGVLRLHHHFGQALVFVQLRVSVPAPPQLGYFAVYYPAQNIDYFCRRIDANSRETT